MSKVHFHETTKLTPAEYIAGLTDFSPGRSKVFSKSADDYLKVHSLGPAEADVTEGSGGVWERLHPLNNATHWGFGLAAGAGYGLLLGSRKPKVWFGLPFGAAVWASGYVVLPQLGVYQPIWKYDLKTLWDDLSVHLVYGTATAGAFCLLMRMSNERSTRA